MAKGKSAEWLTEDGLLILKGLARDGCSDKQIYGRIGISKQTFYDWCNKYPDFSDAIKKGRAPVKAKVKATSGLNCRSGAGSTYPVVKAYPYGTVVTITETSNNWGKTSDGWVSLEWVEKI